jgi:hypothetical protein
MLRRASGEEVFLLPLSRLRERVGEREDKFTPQSEEKR